MRITIILIILYRIFSTEQKLMIEVLENGLEMESQQKDKDSYDKPIYIPQYFPKFNIKKLCKSE